MKKLLLILTVTVLIISSCDYISYDNGSPLTVREITLKDNIHCKYLCSDGKSIQNVILNDSCGKYMIGDTIIIVKYTKK